jgi:hypothetical protein
MALPTSSPTNASAPDAPQPSPPSPLTHPDGLRGSIPMQSYVRRLRHRRYGQPKSCALQISPSKRILWGLPKTEALRGGNQICGLGGRCMPARTLSRRSTVTAAILRRRGSPPCQRGSCCKGSAPTMVKLTLASLTRDALETICHLPPPWSPQHESKRALKPCASVPLSASVPLASACSALPAPPPPPQLEALPWPTCFGAHPP